MRSPSALDLDAPVGGSFSRPLDGYRPTDVGPVPRDWDVVTIGDVAEIVNGATPSTQVREYWGGSIPWCTPSDITDSPGKYLYDTERTLTQAGLESCAASLLPSGSLLLCSRATIGAVKIATFPVSTNQGFKSLVCHEGVDNEFLYYLLLTLEQEMIERASGSTFLEISKRALASVKVPLPPFDEQVRIASALASVDAMQETLERQARKTRWLKLATMQALLTREIRLPGFSGEWATTTLGELGSFSKGKGIRRSDVSDEGVPCVRYGQLYTDFDNYIPRAISRVPPGVAGAALPIFKGDILFAGSGETAEEIGKCAAYVGEKPAVAGGDIVTLRTTEQSPVFLGHLLNSAPVAKQKAQLGQGNAVVHIHARDLAQIEVPLPPLDEQEAIAEVFLDMDADIGALDAARDKVSSVKKGMMQVLLTGRTRLDTSGPEPSAAT